MAAQNKFVLPIVMMVILFFSFGTMAQELDLEFNQAEYSKIFQVLGESEGLNVLVDPSVAGVGTFQLRNVSFVEALDLIAKHSGYPYYLSGNTLLVGTPEPFNVSEHSNDNEVRYVPISKISASEVLDALELVMPRGDIYVGSQSGLVVLHGSQEILDRAEKLILALDSSYEVKPVLDQGRSSLLDIFRTISEELGLNLIADSSIADKYLFIDMRNYNPEELIELIQQLVPVKVNVTDHSLVVSAVSAQSSERLKVYNLNYVEPGDARRALSLLVDEQKIQIDDERKSLIIRGSDSDLAEVDLFLVDFDKAPPQVVLEVWVQEISSDALQDLGVDWESPVSFSGGNAPVFYEFEWEPWELVLALRLLEEQGDAKLLANPQITTLNGQPANIFVGDRVPVVLDGPDGSRSMEFLESGINLQVTPRISDDDYVTILVQPEVSTFIWRTDTEYPQIRTREAETTVRVKNGQPFVLGGLLQDQENELIRRIPFLSQLPVLGQLFQWKESSKTQTEMTIFLIPRIVEDGQSVVYQDFFTQTQ